MTVIYELLENNGNSSETKWHDGFSEMTLFLLSSEFEIKMTK
jgi:hypothetical protein